MVTFFGRRTSAVAEALLLAILVAALAALTMPDGILVATGHGRPRSAPAPNYGLLLAEAIGMPVEGRPSTVSGAEAANSKVEGTLSFAHGDDFAHGIRSRTDYFVTDTSGKATKVAFAHQPSSGLQGAHVRLTGIMHSGTFVPDGGSAQATGSASGIAMSTGAHRVALILFNFANNATEPYTPDFARGVAFTNSDSVAAYYAESSWGQLELSGDVFGWYTIPETNATCDYAHWSDSASQAAFAAGVNLGDYDNIVYAFPTSTACGWTGLANMPGRYSWLNGQAAMGLRTMAHELGHNFGTHHASSLSCTEGGVRVSLAAPASCALGEYGDPYSIMGGATHYHPTTFSRGSFNWLLTGNSQSVATSGDYTLAPAEIRGSSVTSLLIARTATSWFSLEYRQPYGSEFEVMAPTSPVATGVTVRITGDYSSQTQSQLVDSNPATTSFIDAPLAPGMTLVDPVTGTTLTTLSASPGGAVVRISVGQLPSPSDSPSPSATPSPTNGPTPSPAPTDGPTPSPIGEPTPSPVPTPIPTAEPTPMTVPTPSPSPTAVPTSTPTPTSSVDVTPPTAPANLRISLSRSGRVSVAWNASSDNVGVTGYMLYRNGVLVATLSATKWNDNLALKSGSRTYTVVARDAAGNLSPPATVLATR